jgi:hypothetical protein
LILGLILSLISLGMVIILWNRSTLIHAEKTAQLLSEKQVISEELSTTRAALTLLENEDQKVKNDQLQLNLQDLRKANLTAVTEYERILKIKEDGVKTEDLQRKWAGVLSQLGKNDYASASSLLKELSANINDVEKQLAVEAALKIPNVAVNNEAPTSGFSQQKVDTSVGQIAISMVAGDLSSTRVIVDTASDSTCTNDCPVLSLGDYASRNGAFAGINGSYFCPASYPICSDKKNSFDLLVMNKNKTYFNSDNNVYSSNPAVIFLGGSVRFVGAASGWGRDQGIDGMLSNYPLLVSGGNVVFGGDGDPKKGSKGNRSFVANKGNTVYIGVVHGATVAEAAIALKALGMENAMNLDSGGSTALWANGYKVGPGRAIPNAILFVKK